MGQSVAVFLHPTCSRSSRSTASTVCTWRIASTFCSIHKHSGSYFCYGTNSGIPSPNSPSNTTFEGTHYLPTSLTSNFEVPLPTYSPLTEMPHYLHPLSIPSRNNSTSDESPYSQSTPSTAWSTPSSASRGPHFLNIPGQTAQQHIKDADNIDKLANAAVSQSKSFGGSNLFPLRDGLRPLHRDHADVFGMIPSRYVASSFAPHS